jgi:DNA-binding transcriptional ArsR family regulator
MELVRNPIYTGLVKPLIHPALTDVTLEGILHALSDAVRAQIFVEICKREDPRPCTDFLNVNGRSIPKSTLSQYIRTLREAGLIRCERRGVEMYNTNRRAEIDQRFPGLISALLDAHARQQRSSASPTTSW